MDENVVKVVPIEHEHALYLRSQLGQLFNEGHFCDTRLLCDGKEWTVNSLLVALAFPEIFASGAFHSFQSKKTVLLPDHTIVEVESLLGMVLSAFPSLPNTLQLKSEQKDEEEIVKLEEEEETLDSQLLQPETDKAGRKKVRIRSSLAWTFFDKEPGSESATCKLCGKIAKTKQGSTTGLLNHIRIHHPESSLQTELNTVLKLPEDSSAVISRDGKCEVSETGFGSNNDQDDSSGSSNVTGELKLSCRKSNIKTAAKTSNASSLCPECGKEFRHLSQHIKFFHLGTIKHQPVQCDICKRVYTQKSHLREHVRAVHEQIKNHKCNFCGREFFRKLHFRRHMKTMHMDIHEYEHVNCDECGKLFKTRTSLKKHTRTVHLGIKPTRNLFCEECGHCFSQSGSLYSHMRKVHGTEPDIPKNRSNVFKDKFLIDTEQILEQHPELREELEGNQAIN